MSIITGEQASTGEGGVREQPLERRAPLAGYGSTLALSVTLMAGCFLLVMSAALLVIHPGPSHFAITIIRQSQSVKSMLYVGTFVILLPMAMVVVPRLADRIALRQSGAGLGVLAGVLAALLSAALILARIVPGTHHGLRSILVAVGGWWLVAAGGLWRAARPTPWAWLLRLARVAPAVWVISGLAALGALLCVTSLGALSGAALVAGAIAGLIVVGAWGRVRLPTVGRAGWVLDLVVGLLLLLAVTNVVIYHASSAIPNGYFPPGVIQFQQDWILAPTNQLLTGGTLLVNDPSSQYGVGLVYFLAAWFHLAPIGYGTFGLLDGILTSLVYIGSYCALRLARVPRLLAVAAVGLAVTTFIYHLSYPIGSLPEQGPLRFGLPMAVIVGLLAAAVWPGRAKLGRAVALVIVGLASVWAVEAFAYAAFTYLVMIVVEARLRPPGARARWTLVQVGLAAAACVCAHLILAVATLAGSGHLPDWSLYTAYVHGLLLGGREGSVTYGFANWSPGLAMGLACLASAAALVLLIVRAPAVAARQRTVVLALAGSTAYAIASFSYSDNRSSTYLLLYVALPVLLAATLWLWLMLGSRDISAGRRRAGLAVAVSIAVLMLSAAWSTIGTNFSQSALAHAYPGGGLSSALNRLWHAPPIDPRAPAVVRVLDRDMPQKRVLVLLPAAPDLAMEALMRSRRGFSLFLGDPAEDIWIPSIWMPRINREVEALRPGTRVLMDRTALQVTARLRAFPADYSLIHPLARGNPEIEWILHRLDRTFRFVPIDHGPDGLVVVRLMPR
ncbi:MAG: hypothetical protein ACJ764_05710 [Solirubrobacteraceae bacterium]